MTRRPGFRRLALLAALALAAGSLGADLVVLRNGQELRGRVRSKGDRVSIELDVGGTVVVAKGDVERMVVGKAGNETTAEQAAVPAELMKRLEAREQIHVLASALASEKERDRTAAEQELVRTGRAALPMLREMLADGNPTERTHALRALAAIGDPASLPAIRAILDQPKDKALHVLAAGALADIGGPAVAPALTEMLVTSQDDAVRLACLKKLAALRDPFAAPFVVEAVRTPALRATAMKALSRWTDPVALPYVLPLLDSSSASSREHAAQWVVDLITPGHVAAYTKLIEAYKGDKAIRETLFKAGPDRIHKEFPIVGDIELLSAPQAVIQSKAFASLKRQFREIVPRRNEDRAKQPRFWQTQRDNATRARVLVVPVGATPYAWARELAKELERSLTGLKIPIEHDRKAVQASGGDGRRLLAALGLRQLSDPRSARVIGVTADAVRMPGYDTALAPAHEGGAVLVSLAHLGEDRERALRRARRLALHALARSFGLPQSKSAACPSSAVYEASDLDAKSPGYSAETRDLLTPLWDAERAAAAFRYRDAAQSLSRLGRDRKSKGLRMQAACMFERALDFVPAIAEWKAVQQMEKTPAVASLIDRRVKLLTRADKWLAKKNPQPPPARDRPPRRGGR